MEKELSNYEKQEKSNFVCQIIMAVRKMLGKVSNDTPVGLVSKTCQELGCDANCFKSEAKR